jgi:hypothetical protein
MDHWSLRCFPADDEAFCTAAGDAMAAATADRTIDREAIANAVGASIADILRAASPDVAVAPMDSLAAIGNGRVWYVYRDGRPARSA